jgi:hypothetical protein
MQLELGTDEVKTIIEILRYSLDNCPIESISKELNITNDKVEDLIAELGKALESE